MRQRTTHESGNGMLASLLIVPTLTSTTLGFAVLGMRYLPVLNLIIEWSGDPAPPQAVRGLVGEPRQRVFSQWLRG